MVINFLYLILNSFENGLTRIEDIFTCGPTEENINSIITEEPTNIIENENFQYILALENLVNRVNSNVTNIGGSLEEVEIELLTPITRATSASHSFGFFMNQYTFFRDLSAVNIGSPEILCTRLQEISNFKCNEQTLRKWHNTVLIFSFFNPLPHLLIIINNYLEILKVSPSANPIKEDLLQLNLFYEFQNICLKDTFWKSQSRLEFLHQIRSEEDVEIKEQMIRNWVDKYMSFIEELKTFSKNNLQEFNDSKEVKKKRESVLQQTDKIQNTQLTEIKRLVNDMNYIVKKFKKNL